LLKRGCNAIGVEYDHTLVNRLNAEGIKALQGAAEKLPFNADSFEAIVCSVVIPYTDERKAITEFARILAPRGRLLISYHGMGYGLKYLLNLKNPRRSFYGFRMLANSCAYRVSGFRLPGWLGDTLCQSRFSLRKLYNRLGLRLNAEFINPGPLGLPSFIYHDLSRV
jgi:SAM-dependent methyltransferase